MTYANILAKIVQKSVFFDIFRIFVLFFSRSSLGHRSVGETGYEQGITIVSFSCLTSGEGRFILFFINHIVAYFLI